MSRTTRFAIIFSSIAVAVVIGFIMYAYSPAMAGIFRIGGSQDNQNESTNVPYDTSFGFTTRYTSTFTVGDEMSFNGTARNGKEPYSFEWKFSDGVNLNGQRVTRSFDTPGTYYFNLTVTDADNKQVKSSNLDLNVLQEIPKSNATANGTSPHDHN